MSVSRRLSSLLELLETDWDHDHPVTRVAASTILDDRLGAIAIVVIFLSAETTLTLPCELTHSYSLSAARTHYGARRLGSPTNALMRAVERVQFLMGGQW